MSSGAWTGAAVATVTAAYALGSRRLSTTPISSAMVFVGAGILIGPAVLDIVDLAHDTAPIVALLEVTLALVLFSDAMTVRRQDLRTGGFLPERLLGIGLPLSIGAGWLLAWPLLPGLTMWSSLSSAPSSPRPTPPSERPPSPIPGSRRSYGTG